MNRSSVLLESNDTDEYPPARFANYFDALYDNRKLIAVTTAAVLAIGIGYAFLSQPVYRADILVQVEENTHSTKNVLGEVSAMFDVKTAASAETQVIGSRLVVSRAVDKLKLFIDASPRYLPVIGRWIGRQSEHWSEPGPYGYVWGSERIDVSTFNVPEQLLDRPFVLTKGDGRDYEIRYGDIELHGTAGKVLHATTAYGPLELLVDKVDANPGATFELRRFSRLETTEKLRRNLTIAEKGKESDVIGVSLDGTDPKKIGGTLEAIASEYVRQNVQRKSEEAERSIRFLELQLPELKKQLAVSETRFNKYRASHGTIDLGEEASSLLQRGVSAQTRRVELQQKRQELLARFTEEHPAIRSIDAQLRVAQQEAAQVAQSTALLPPLEQNVLRLQRDVQVSTELYTTLQNTLEQLRLIRAGRTGNIRLVDAAVVPDVPIRPRRELIVAASLMMGLFAGIAAALARQRLFDAIDDPYEVELRTGLPVYASIPYSRSEEKLTHIRRRSESQSLVLAGESAIDPAIESLRSFRTALEYTMVEARNRTVLITGPTPRIGKSFVALNLAAVLGASGKRVLLIDSDMRRGFLHRHLGDERSPGLSDYIRGTFRAQDVIRPTRFAGVDFIPTGSQVASPSDVLSNANLGALLNEFSAAYDVVLLDGPPILSAADASRLACFAGTTFLVARQGVTGVGELRESARQLTKIGLSVCGVIVNGLRMRPGRYSYGYGRYRYSSYIYKPYER
jgi:tyrosine-protein kinase Etk/Wzc